MSRTQRHLIDAYANKFAAETIYAEPTAVVAPTDAALTARLANCVRPPTARELPLIRAAFFREHIEPQPAHDERPFRPCDIPGSTADQMHAAGVLCWSCDADDAAWMEADELTAVDTRTPSERIAARWSVARHRIAKLIADRQINPWGYGEPPF